MTDLPDGIAPLDPFRRKPGPKPTRGLTACRLPGCAEPVFFVKDQLCSKHYQRLRAHGDPTVKLTLKGEPPITRLLADVEITESGCWLRTTALVKGGYSLFWVDVKSVYCHRWAYEFWVGSIPEGWEVDHLCRRPGCVNPEHLEAVPPRVNWERSRAISRLNALKTECKNGHPFEVEGGRRLCRVCARATKRRYKERLRLKKAAS